MNLAIMLNWVLERDFTDDPILLMDLSDRGFEEYDDNGLMGAAGVTGPPGATAV